MTMYTTIKMSNTKSLSAKQLEEEAARIMNGEESDPDPFEDSGSDWEEDNLEAESSGSDSETDSENNSFVSPVRLIQAGWNRPVPYQIQHCKFTSKYSPRYT
uniref:Uncharacterized protein LOC114332407 n=1 Tax=Diabrotica virgifera virgifera TaxID=50390 RepID=A0A6P7FYU5_DIAVI